MGEVAGDVHLGNARAAIVEHSDSDAGADEKPEQQQGGRTEPAAAPAPHRFRRRWSTRVARLPPLLPWTPAGRRGRRCRRERSLNLVDGAYCGPRMQVIALPIATP